LVLKPKNDGLAKSQNWDGKVKSSRPVCSRQVQGAQILRSEACLGVRRNDEGCSATPQMDFLRAIKNGLTLTTHSDIMPLYIQKKEHLMAKDIKRQESYLELLVSSSIDAFIATDMKGTINLFSKGAENIFGCKAEDVLGTPISNYYVMGRDEAKKIMKILYQEGGLQNYETVMIIRNGKKVNMNLSVSLLKNSNGELIGTLGIGKDFTEFKRIERQLQQSEKLATVGELAAGIAHEVGTPLNVILGTAEYLMMEMEGDDPKIEELKIIISQAEHITKLIHQLLNFSRYNKPEFKSIDINSLVRDVLKLTDLQIAKEKIKVFTDLQSDVPSIIGDDNQLQQVFINIIVNAVHAMPQGGTLTIASRLDISESSDPHSNGFVEISISDTGFGIPSKDIPKIFDPFFTTKDIDKGTGLGLTVSHRIVEDHGGTIDVESKVNEGTRFTVKLPIQIREDTNVQ
jgi:PAS domain S-box-containing protein